MDEYNFKAEVNEQHTLITVTVRHKTDVVYFVTYNNDMTCIRETTPHNPANGHLAATCTWIARCLWEQWDQE